MAGIKNIRICGEWTMFKTSNCLAGQALCGESEHGPRYCFRKNSGPYCSWSSADSEEEPCVRRPRDWFRSARYLTICSYTTARPVYSLASITSPHVFHWTGFFVIFRDSASPMFSIVVFPSLRRQRHFDEIIASPCRSIDFSRYRRAMVKHYRLDV
jgi:hypothetical protein